jgi:hypothetical protein
MSSSKRSSRDKYLDSLKKRYAKARKKERGQILDEYVQTTGYHRKHAIAILSGQYQPAPRPICRPRKRVYGVEDAKALGFLSDLFDGINAKRLRAVMNVELDGLYRRGVLQVSRACYRRLKHISPASIDRLRARYGPPRPKSRHRTKPGTLLKSQIPIRTWAEWKEDRPGFVEMDLVGHDGGNQHGDYCLTLDFTDVKTGWTECVAVRNKAQKYVFEAIRLARRRLPFPLLGMDSDNGGEFINDELFRYCRDEHITFTRGRSGHKNDNAYVEQKNWSAVRRYVGDLRYDTPAQLALLNQLYEHLHLYLNFFIPVMKLKEKVRTGSKVKRVYDEPQTPYARVLASPDVSPKIKARLLAQYRHLDVVQLKQEIDQLVDQLWQDPHRS